MSLATQTVACTPRPGCLALAMITATRSQPTIHASIASLRRAGFTEPLHVFAEPQAEVPRRPGVVVHRNPSVLGMWRNWTQAARFLLSQSDAPFLLLLEDDIQFAPCAAAALERLLRSADSADFGLATLYTPSHNPVSQSACDGWTALPQSAFAWGSLGYCFRRDSLARILATTTVREHRASKDNDGVVSRAVRESQLKLYAHHPSLLRHTGDANSTVGHFHADNAEVNNSFRPDYNRYAWSRMDDARPTARAAMLSPYFGEWPEWLPLTLQSCGWNPAFDWIIVTDNPRPARVPGNIRFVSITLDELRELVAAQLKANVGLLRPYKLCDLRPAFGQIFEPYIAPYDFFGWTDLDVIFGNLARTIPAPAWQHDAVSFHRGRLSGHFCMFRNTARMRSLYRQLPNWREAIADPRWHGLDDRFYGVLRDERLFEFESFNTPHARDIPWTDGSCRYPNEWTWQDGGLTNDIDGDREFAYLHFMVWKGGEWGRRHGGAQWEKLDRLVHGERSEFADGFTIGESGFRPINTVPRLETASATITCRAPSADTHNSQPVRQPVQSLWIGPRLSRLERLCVESFLAQGHPFHLYVYEPVADVPPSVTLLDANRILPSEMVFRCTDREHAGSLAGFADVFRYKLLAERGGWWVDTDMICLHPLPYVDDELLAWEDERTINNAILHSPPGSRLMRAAFDETQRTCNARQFGEAGPRLMTHLIHERGMLHLVYPPSAFYPIPCRDFRALWTPWRPAPPNAFTLHAWREMWRRNGFTTDGPFPGTSILGQLERRFSVDSTRVAIV